MEVLPIFANTKMELPVMLAAFYGLRRSEVIGLQWSAIDFERKSSRFHAPLNASMWMAKWWTFPSAVQKQGQLPQFASDSRSRTGFTESPKTPAPANETLRRQLLQGI